LQSDPSLRFVKQSTNRRILEDIENLTGTKSRTSVLCVECGEWSCQPGLTGVLWGAGMLDDIEELSPEDIIERNQLYLSERNERKIYMDKALHITFLQLIFSLLLTPMYSLLPPFAFVLFFFFFFFVLCSTADINALIVAYFIGARCNRSTRTSSRSTTRSSTFPSCSTHVRQFISLSLFLPFIYSLFLSRRNTDINHPANGPIIPELVERSLEMKVRRRTLLICRRRPFCSTLLVLTMAVIVAQEGAYRMLKLLSNRLFSPEQYQHMKRIAIGVRSFALLL
jgi:hypothetical protein